MKNAITKTVHHQSNEKLENRIKPDQHKKSGYTQVQQQQQHQAKRKQVRAHQAAEAIYVHGGSICICGRLWLC
jgi:hypothetical protein